MSLMLATAQISVWPGLIFSSGWNWPLTVNCTSRWFSGSAGFSATFFGRAGEGHEIRRDELRLAAVVVRRQRPGLPGRDVLGALGGVGDVHRGQARLIGAVGQLGTLGRFQRAHELRPARSC